jgi:hypothetical protein
MRRGNSWRCRRINDDGAASPASGWGSWCASEAVPSPPLPLPTITAGPRSPLSLYSGGETDDAHSRASGCGACCSHDCRSYNPVRADQGKCQRWFSTYRTRLNIQLLLSRLGPGRRGSTHSLPNKLHYIPRRGVVQSNPVHHRYITLFIRMLRELYTTASVFYSVVCCDCRRQASIRSRTVTS